MKKVILVMTCLVIAFTSCKKDELDNGPYKISGRIYNGTTNKGWPHLKLSMTNSKQGDALMGISGYNEDMGYIYTDSDGYFQYSYSRKGEGSSISMKCKEQYLCFPLNQNSTQNLCISDSATLIIHLHSNNPLTSNDSFYVKTADKLIGLKGPLPVDYTIRMRQIPRPSAVWIALEFSWAKTYKEFLSDYIKGVKNYQRYSVEGDPAINEYTINY